VHEQASLSVSRVILEVVVDVPIPGPFDYGLPQALAATQPAQALVGQLVLLPWAKGQRLGLVTKAKTDTDVAPEKLKDIVSVLCPELTLPTWWMQLTAFAAQYYHRSPGELALPAIPKLLRSLPKNTGRKTATPWARNTARAAKLRAWESPEASSGVPELTSDQVIALDALLPRLPASSGFSVTLLRGVTGSGKTEVYLRAVAHILQDPQAQALLLVPEIGLTPQFLASLQARFPGMLIAALNSGMADGERAAHWQAAVTGQARLIVGTRLAVFTPFHHLRLVVVDEEHDPSYKQAEGVHYSGRDMAIALASHVRCAVVLGSATPSMESWDAAQRGRYHLLELPDRVGKVALPTVHLINVRGQCAEHGLSKPAIDAIRDCVGKGEQALIFLNRRGYAPVLHCGACSWLSQCNNCSAYRVLHRNKLGRYRLVCHHCSSEAPAPRACPDCGNVDLSPLGQGTQKLEESLQVLFPQARIGRVDRDVARKRGATEAVLAAAHAGEVDILVGTQMLAKGHHFTGLSLVVVVNADSGLYAADFRAPERLFANLMQVSGRAGRTGLASKVLVQTETPEHPLFTALVAHNYAAYAGTQLAERQQAGLPPYTYQALLRAQAKELAVAIEFLRAARELAQTLDAAGDCMLYDPVPMPMVRVANIERAQLLLESRSRRHLHLLLGQLLPQLHEQRTPVRWQLDVDPQEI
jgi:primosomal protein N' (replication factor Y) (superfamily II helicase)